MEKILHGISGSLHILAAVTWIGSMIYSQFAVVPALKHLGAPRSNAINMIAKGRFSPLVWASLVVLIVTGTYVAFDEAAKLAPIFQQPAGIALFIKLLFVAVLIGILLVQIYNYGPKMKKLINPATPQNQENDLAMARTSNTVNRLSSAHLIIGIVIIVLSVILSELLE
ncbi:Copper resistance protein D [Pelotomaculum sp. FP]|uniref:CopD family protein n=1 Tax=Pelotomaculum sp. FP TaxID=261474 RepID=UPI0010647D3B|nr:CopD family protein [Pelotomaculum sp. FP]TEB15331.1 Copper resistance protein D [Pelotomaculum sp. FP]